ncbi:MAG: DUF4276 family protein [Bacteroidia bacterium]|nr:DUF4276 family protein [Bacteroidia bacterium]
MNVLTSAFWGEGPTDERFLPKLIQRVLEDLLLACARGEWEVLEPIVLQSRENRFADALADVARQSKGLTLLFVHTDADAQDEAEKAWPHKLAPGLSRLRELREGDACQNVVAVIPVTKIENWKLADLEALEHILGGRLDWQHLGLNLGAAQREQAARSKELLAEVIRTANQRRHRRIQLSPADLDEPLARRMDLSRLAPYTSFQRFLGRLKTTLTGLNILTEDCTADLR